MLRSPPHGTAFCYLPLCLSAQHIDCQSYTAVHHIRPSNENEIRTCRRCSGVPRNRDIPLSTLLVERLWDFVRGAICLHYSAFLRGATSAFHGNQHGCKLHASDRVHTPNRSPWTSVLFLSTRDHYDQVVPGSSNGMLPTTSSTR